MLHPPRSGALKVIMPGIGTNVTTMNSFVMQISGSKVFVFDMIRATARDSRMPPDPRPTSLCKALREMHN